MNSATMILILVLGFLKACSSYPANEKYGYKEGNPISIPLFLLSFPMEVDEPLNTIENLPSIPYYTDKKNKRTQLFPDNSEACCPTVVEVIEPLGGKNRSGDLVELYQGDGVRQRFYEVSCDPSVADQHCKFLDRRHTSHSKCVQQYSYTYALVRNFGISYEDTANGGWRLDYIQVRSGCSCQISPRRSSHS